MKNSKIVKLREYNKKKFDDMKTTNKLSHKVNPFFTTTDIWNSVRFHVSEITLKLVSWLLNAWTLVVLYHF